MLAVALTYLLLINVLTFVVFAGDKRRAVAGARRVSERKLLTLAIAGGSIGGIAAQQLLRHKTRKQPFATLLWLIAGVQAVAAAAAALLL